MTARVFYSGRTALTQDSHGEVSQQGDDEEDAAEDIGAASEAQQRHSVTRGTGAKHHKSPSTTSTHDRVSPVLDGPFEVWVILPGLPCAGKNNNQQRDTTNLSQS